MLKETFKMRKIGKHLVNVSMLSLAIAPVVGSALAPVTVLAAEQGETRKVEKIPFKTETKEDPSLPKGEKKVIQKGVEGEKEIVTSTKANTKQRARNIILWIDESGSFQNAGGHDYNESLATSIINSLGPNDKMMILGNENTDDMLMLTYSKIFAEPTNDKSKLLAALKKTDGSARSVNVLQNGSMDSLIKAMGVDAKDITLVSLLDDTAITAGQSKTPNYLSEFKSKGGTILGYVPQVPAPGSNKPAFASSTEAALKAVGAKVVKPVEYRDGNAPDVAKQIVDSISSETVTYEPVTTEKVIKEPVNEIIAIGTKGAKSDVTEKKVPFETIRKEDPTLEEGQEKVIQEGVEGVIKVTTTYDTQKGQKVEGSEKVTEKETVKKVDKIIAVGTKGSKSEVTEKKVPFETIKKDDPTLEEGQEKVVQEGVDGVIKVTTTYETQKGEKVKGSEKVTEEKVTDKVDKIIAVGTKGSKSEVTEKKVPFETIYKQDPTLKKGEEKVLQEGVEGVIKVTTTYETQKGKKVDGSEKVTEETVTEKVDKIVAQGAMEKRKVRYRVVDSKGQELVKQTDVMEAYQDEEYKVETPKLDGYRLELAKDSVPATGKVADRDVLVTFVAVKIGKPVTLKFVDESGSEIAEKKVLTGENAEVDTEFTGEAPETIEKDGVKYAFVGIKQTGSKERKVSGKVTDQEQVIEAVYAKPKELPKTSEQAKQRNTAIIALLSVVGLGGLATYLGLRKRDEK